MYKIYLISSGLDEKQYKIGYTRRSVEERIKEFKTGNSNDIEIVSVFESKWGTKIEANLKRRFRTYNISGEWFNLPQLEINNFNSYCESIHNNLELLVSKNSYIIDRGGI